MLQTTDWDEVIEGPLAWARTGKHLTYSGFDSVQAAWDRMAEKHPTVEDADPK